MGARAPRTSTSTRPLTSIAIESALSIGAGQSARDRAVWAVGAASACDAATLLGALVTVMLDRVKLRSLSPVVRLRLLADVLLKTTEPPEVGTMSQLAGVLHLASAPSPFHTDTV